jgi:hypothetical protein
MKRLLAGAFPSSPLRQCLRQTISSVSPVFLNGTTTDILTRMRDGGVDFDVRSCGGAETWVCGKGSFRGRAGLGCPLEILILSMSPVGAPLDDAKPQRGIDKLTRAYALPWNLAVR